jgi:hypothetical protein
MSISKRRRLGVLLIAISAAATGLFIVVDYAHGITHGGSHTVQVQTTNIIDIPFGEYHTDFIITDTPLGIYDMIPIGLCGLIGLACLVWPTRKRPVLKK